MNYESLIVAVQWAVIGFFVLFHFLNGFRRGTKPTLYYTIVSFVLTFVLLFGVSFLTIRTIFTPGSLLEFIERYTTIPDDIRVYLTEPELSAVLFAVIDVVIRIVAFIVLYPIVKWLLTMIVFRPLYRGFFDKGKEERSLKVVNKGKQAELVIVPRKRRVNIFSRVGGAALGAVRGFVVAFVFLLPLIMLGSFSRGLEGDNSSEENISNFEKILLSNGESTEDNQFLEILRAAQSVEKYGIGQFTSNIKIGDKTLDESVFDFVFTTKVVTKDEKKDLVISDEIKMLGQVATVLIENGYLDSDFDIKSINHEDHFEDLEFLLSQIGNSNLVNLLYSAGVSAASKHLLPDILGYDPNADFDEDGNKLHTKDVIAALKLVDLSGETDSLTKAIEQALLLGSVGELMEMVEDPNLFLELSVEEKRQVAKILHEVSNLELLVGANLLIESLIRLESPTNDGIKENIDWVDNPVEYLQERLAFILEDNRHFIGEDGDIAAIANFVEAMFSDEFEDFDYTIFTGELSPDLFLSEEVSPIISQALVNIVEIETLIKLLPLGVDYYVYGTKPELISEFADELVESLSDADYREEILNIDSIYKLIVQLGLEAYFEEDADFIAVTDNILSDDASLLAVRQIIHHLFEESQAVNDILEIVAEPLVESFVSDEEIKGIALKVVNSEIRYGTEINKLLDVVDSMYSFTSLSKIKSIFDNGDMDAYLNLAADFGGINEADFLQFKNALTSLYTLQIAGIDILDLVKNKSGIEQLVIPENASLNYDLNRVLDLAYEIAKPLNVERASGVDVLDINLSYALDHEAIIDVLRFSEADENSILLASAVEYIKTLEFTIDNLGTIKTPDELYYRDFNDEIWIDELNNIITGLFRTLPMLADDEFILSYNHLTQNVKGLEDIPVDIISRFGIFETYTEESLGLILNSLFVRSNATTLTSALLENVFESQNFNINLPELAIAEDGYIIGSELTELVVIAGLGVLYLDDENNPYNNMKELVDSLSLEKGVTTFNILHEDVVAKVANSKIVNGIFREALLNEEIHSLVYERLSALNLAEDLSPINDISSGVFDFDVALVNGEVPLNTLHELLLGLQSIQVPATLVQNPSQENIMDFLNVVNTENLISILEIKLVHELVDNVIKLTEVKEVGANYFDNLLINLYNNGYTINLNYEDYYNVIHMPVDSDNLISINEVKDLVNVFAALKEVVDFNDLNNIKVLEVFRGLEDVRVGNKNGYEVLTKPILLRGLMGTALNDDELLDFLADFASSRLVINGETAINLEGDAFKLTSDFFENGKVLKHNHLLDLVLAVAAQDETLIERNFKVEVSDVTNLLRAGLSFSQLSRLEQIYNSDIIEFMLQNVIENEEVANLATDLINDQIANLAINMDINPVYINNSDLDLHYELINLDAMTKLVVAIDELNINDFSELTNIKSIKDLGLLLDLRNTDRLARNIFEIPFLLHALDVVLTSDALGEMAEELVEVKALSRLPFATTAPSSDTYVLDSSLITTDNFVDLVLAVYGANLDVEDFKGNALDIVNRLLGYKVANQVEEQGISHLYNSNIIKHFVEILGENEEVHQIGADAINHYLVNVESSLNVTFPNITTADLAISNTLFNEESMLLTLQFIKDLELTDINELTNIRSVKAFGELLNLDTDAALLDRLVDIPLIYHVYERVLISEFGSEALAVLVNEKLLPLLNADLEQVDSDAFRIDPSVVTKGSFRNLFIAVYGSGLDVDTNFNDILAITKTLDSDTLVAGNTNKAIAHIYGYELIPHILERLVESEQVQEGLVSVLNQQLGRVNLNAIEDVTKEELNITYELFNLEAMIKVLDAINSLNITTIEDLTNARTINDFGNILRLETNSDIVLKVFNVPVIDHALTTVLTHDMFGNVLKELVDTRVLPRLPFEVTSPSADSYRLNSEHLTGDNYADLILAIYGSGLDVDTFSGSIDILGIVDTLLTDKLAGGINREGVRHIYGSRIVDDLLTRVIESEETHQTLADVINHYIGNLEPRLEVVLPDITAADLALNKSLVDVEAAYKMLTLVQDLELTDINELTNIRSVKAFGELLNLDTDAALLDRLVDIPLIYHVYERVLISEFGSEALAVLVNEKLLPLLNADLEQVDSDAFRIDPSVVTKGSFRNLFIAVYGSGLDVDTNFNDILAITKTLDSDTLVAGNTNKAIAHIYGYELIPHILERLVESEQVQEGLVSVLNQQLGRVNLNAIEDVTKEELNITYELFNLEAMIKVLDAINSLNITTIEDLTNARTINDFGNILRLETNSDIVLKVFNVPVIDHALTTVLTHDMFGNVLKELVDTRVLPRLPFEVTSPSADSYRLNSEHLTGDNYADLILAIYGSGLDVDTFSGSIDILGIVDTLLTDKLAGGINREGVRHIYGSRIIDNLLTRVIEHEQTHQMVADIINHFLGEVETRLDVSLSRVVASELEISKALVDEAATVHLLEAIQSLGVSEINELTSIRTLSEVADLLDLRTSDEKAMKLFSTPVLEHALKIGLSHKVASELMKALVDREVLPRLPFEVSSPGISAYEINKEHLTAANYTELLVALYGSGLDVDQRSVLNAISILLENNVSAGRTMLGVEHLYNSKLVEYVIGYVEKDGVQDLLVDLINGYIDQLATRLNVSSVHVTRAELNITKDLFDVNSAIALLTAVNELELTSLTELTSIRSIEAAANIFSLAETDEKVRNFVAAPLVFHVLEILLTTDVITEMGHEYVNRLLPEGISINIKDFVFDEELITEDDIVDLVISIYGSKVLESKNLRNPLIFKELLEGYEAGGNIATGIEHLFASEIIHSMVDRVLRSDQVRNTAFEQLNKLLKDRNINLTINTPSETKIPENALDSSGKISKQEFVLLVEAAAALELTSYSELTQVRTLSDVLNIVSRQALDAMLESEIIYYAIGYVPHTATVRNKVASEINNRFNLGVTFEGDDFLMDKYPGLFEESGSHQGYIRKEEFVLLLDALENTNIDRLLLSGNVYNIMNRAVDVLLEEDTLDYYLDSVLLTSLLDKFVNVKGTKFETVFINLMNRAAGSVIAGEFSVSDDLFNYHANAFDANGFINPEEVRHILEAIQLMNVRQGSNLDVLLSLVDRNIDENNEDDFDRAYRSFVLQSFISNLVLSDSFSEILLTELNSRQGRITITEEHIAIPDEIVVEGLITKEEIKALLRTGKALEIGDLDFGKLGFMTPFDLVGGNIINGRDDFDRMLDSILIHTIFDRVFKSEGLGELVGELVSDMFDKDLTSANMKPADKLLDENGKFMKSEIKAIFVSIKLLEANSMSEMEELGLADLIALIGKNNLGGQDDLERFLESGYIATIMSRLLASSTIREQIASGGKFEEEDLGLAAAKDSDGFITVEELYNLFVALNTLGITDFNDMDISNETLKSLTDDQLELVLLSAYMYQVIDLTLKAQLNDIPESALINDASDKFDGYIKKSEISALVKALEILDVDSPDGINSDNITIQMLDDLIELESAIINRLLSEELLKLDDIEVPEESTENDNKDIKVLELRNLVRTLSVLANGNMDTLITAIATDGFTRVQYLELLTIELDSLLVTRLLSKGITDGLNSTPDASYRINGKDLTRSELEAIRDTFFILDIQVITSDGLAVDNLTIQMLDELIGLESPLIARLISEQLSDEENLDIPEASYEINNLDIRRDELGSIVRTLMIIANEEETTLINNIETDVLTQSQYQALLGLEDTSPFVRRLISKAIIDAFTDIPEDSFEDENTITRTEMENLDAALTILGITVIDENGFELDGVTVSNLSDIHNLESPLFTRLISQSIIGANIHTDESLEANGKDIKVIEIDGIIAAMTYLGITNIGNVEGELTLTKLKGLSEEQEEEIFDNSDTTIIYQLTSDILIEKLGNTLYDMDNDPRGLLVPGEQLIKREHIVTLIGELEE